MERPMTKTHFFAHISRKTVRFLHKTVHASIEGVTLSLLFKTTGKLEATGEFLGSEICELVDGNFELVFGIGVPLRHEFLRLSKNRHALLVLLRMPLVLFAVPPSEILEPALHGPRRLLDVSLNVVKAV